MQEYAGRRRKERNREAIGPNNRCFSPRLNGLIGRTGIDWETGKMMREKIDGDGKKFAKNCKNRRSRFTYLQKSWCRMRLEK
jgi:hypothetical protein